MNILLGGLFGLLSAILGAAAGVAVAFFVSCVTLDDSGGLSVIIMAGPVGLLVGFISGAIAAPGAWRRLRQVGASRARRWTPFAGVLLGLPALTMGLLWAGHIASLPLSDAALMANFRRHRATFERLVLMSQSDKGLTVVDKDSTDPTDPQTVGVSPARIAEYRRLLQEGDVAQGLVATDAPRGVGFCYWTEGAAASGGSEKGYVYLTTPPAHTLPSPDGCAPNDQGTLRAYRHVEGHWYLFYEYLPG